MTWIDLHTHLNFLDVEPEEAVKEALAAGVERLITIGTCAKDHSTVLELAERFQPYVFCTLGVHPHDAKEYGDQTEKFLHENLSRERVVAVGEIGLDYYYDNSPRDVQQEVFRRQLELAQKFSLPVQIHTRDAEEDTVSILHEFSGQIRGVIHCFTGTEWLAKEALGLGLNISISGVVTFKNAETLREIVKQVPLNRLHVETDAPFLTPVPFRGKKNRPVYVVSTAEKVAELKGVELSVLAQETKRNALDVFTKLQWS